MVDRITEEDIEGFREAVCLLHEGGGDEISTKELEAIARSIGIDPTSDAIDALRSKMEDKNQAQTDQENKIPSGS